VTIATNIFLNAQYKFISHWIWYYSSGGTLDEVWIPTAAAYSR